MTKPDMIRRRAVELGIYAHRGEFYWTFYSDEGAGAGELGNAWGHRVALNWLSGYAAAIGRFRILGPAAIPGEGQS